MRYGKPYILSLNNVFSTGNIIILTSPAQLDTLNKVSNYFKCNVPYTKDPSVGNYANYIAHFTCQSKNPSVQYNDISFVPEKGKGILDYNLIAHVTAEAYLHKNDNGNMCLSLVPMSFNVIAIENHYKQLGDLPSIDKFIDMSNTDRMKYYSNPAGPREDVKASYVVVYCETKNRYYIISHQDHVGVLKYVYPSQAWKIIKEDKDLRATSLDGKTYHYRAVLRSSKQLMEDVQAYLANRNIDVRGMWYDEDKDKCSHVNLHLASQLPLEYFMVLFCEWERDFGTFWCDYVFDPYGWRVYAARNHHMSIIGNEIGYVDKQVVYRNMFGFLSNYVHAKDSPICLTKTTISKIMDYIVDRSEYEMLNEKWTSSSNHTDEWSLV